MVLKFTIEPLMLKTLYIAIIFGLIAAAYLFGAYSHSRNLWPIELLVQLKKMTLPRLQGSYDSYTRLIDYPNKKATPCVPQTEDTAVLLVIGQSNAANHAAKKFTTHYPGKVVNYFNGKCYIAASPLLGASGEWGEFITPLADQLIQSGAYQSVVIIASAIGGTSITRWQRDGDLNEMLLNVLRLSNKQYTITHVIWHQGENDYINVTSAKNYMQMFNSLMQTLQENGVNAPIFMSIASKCGGNIPWQDNNPTAIAQQSLIDHQHILFGVNTDKLLAASDRQADGCHFRESGQLKTAEAVAQAIRSCQSIHLY